jgi:hypothetical protein
LLLISELPSLERSNGEVFVEGLPRGLEEKLLSDVLLQLHCIAFSFSTCSRTLGLLLSSTHSRRQWIAKGRITRR